MVFTVKKHLRENNTIDGMSFQLKAEQKNYESQNVPFCTTMIFILSSIPMRKKRKKCTKGAIL